MRSALTKLKSKLNAFCFPLGDLNVTLVVFSGRPDPQWTLLSTDPSYNEIAGRVERARNGKFTHPPEDMPARLGYKGFLVQDTMKTESDLIVGQTRCLSRSFY